MFRTKWLNCTRSWHNALVHLTQVFSNVTFRRSNGHLVKTLKISEVQIQVQAVCNLQPLLCLAVWITICWFVTFFKSTCNQLSVLELWTHYYNYAKKKKKKYANYSAIQSRIVRVVRTTFSVDCSRWVSLVAEFCAGSAGHFTRTCSIMTNSWTLINKKKRVVTTAASCPGEFLPDWNS